MCFFVVDVYIFFLIVLSISLPVGCGRRAISHESAAAAASSPPFLPRNDKTRPLVICQTAAADSTRISLRQSLHTLYTFSLSFIHFVHILCTFLLDTALYIRTAAFRACCRRSSEHVFCRLPRLASKESGCDLGLMNASINHAGGVGFFCGGRRKIFPKFITPKTQIHNANKFIMAHSALTAMCVCVCISQCLPWKARNMQRVCTAGYKWLAQISTIDISGRQADDLFKSRQSLFFTPIAKSLTPLAFFAVAMFF